jgi:menaquinone-dependent protoporphyrinogen oxidase
MAKILVVYGSSYGQTAKVVNRITEGLDLAGHRGTVWKGDALPADYSLDGFDGFLIAGSVVLGHHQDYLRDFVRRHAGRLNAAPSAFVSVCGALSEAGPEGTARAATYVAEFLAATGWRPRLTASFGGAVAYTRYGMLTRWIMKLISRRTGRPTDTSRDWEFTDWRAVDRFATAYAESVTAGRELPRAPRQPTPTPARIAS